MNIESTLNKGINILKANDITNPILDSEILLSESIKKNRKHIILNSKETINSKQLNNFDNFIERRKNGEPIAYLINKKEFWKDEFYVNKDVLIPRPDTEVLIEQVIKMYPKNSYLQILDIGTGSGCIILSLLRERKHFYGTGIDVSKKSINVSKFNAKKLNLTNRVKFIHSSVDNFRIGKYDVIVSNPPYIKFRNLKYLEKDIINYEPKLSLSGGLEGFSEIRKVINNASYLIKRKGKLILEIGYDQKIKTNKLLREKGFYINKTLKDYGKNDRCIISIKI